MAMIAAKGRLPESPAPEILDGAKIAQMMMRAIVEITTVTKLRASGSCWNRLGVMVVALLIYGSTFAARSLSKASVKELTEF
jgi:hypothetical protein